MANGWDGMRAERERLKRVGILLNTNAGLRFKR